MDDLQPTNWDSFIGTYKALENGSLLKEINDEFL